MSRTPSRSDGIEALPAGVGCVLISVACTLVGLLLLYSYFVGTPTRRGNPVMGLAGGILFIVLGVLGLVALIRRGEARR